MGTVKPVVFEIFQVFHYKPHSFLILYLTSLEIDIQ